MTEETSKKTRSGDADRRDRGIETHHDTAGSPGGRTATAAA